MNSFEQSKHWAAHILIASMLAGCAGTGTTPGTEADSRPNDDTYEEGDIAVEVDNFFGEGAEGIADVLNKVFADQGRPNGYIKGEESGGALGFGVRYGRGTLHLKNGETRQVYWRGPSLGFDFGGNAAKVFVLVYDLPDVASAFQRYPGVDGSLYFVGGVGVNYNKAGDIALAPIRFGVGWRQGVSVGYMHLSSKKSWIPF